MAHLLFLFWILKIWLLLICDILFFFLQLLYIFYLDGHILKELFIYIVLLNMRNIFFIKESFRFTKRLRTLLRLLGLVLKRFPIIKQLIFQNNALLHLRLFFLMYKILAQFKLKTLALFFRQLNNINLIMIFKTA